MSNQIVISSGAKVRNLDGVLTGSTGVVGSVPLGAANGVATLDSGGKVPVSQLPSSVVTYLGTWNAATNTPTLTNGTGDAGDMYICNVAGTVNFGAGPITFAVGDWVLYGSGTWQKSNGQNGTVTSVAVTESGDALSITGSPITTAGTINIGFAGNSGQYINGEGNLTTFPSLITEAQNLVTEVYNSTGATLTKGTVVYINGGQGNLPTITKAIATGDSTSAQTYGVVRANISNNNNGYVTVIGSLTDIDTQAYAAGTQLYLSGTTAGAWTSTKPSAPIHLVYVGIVVRSHPTQGVVEIRIQNGYEISELHDVAISSVANNDGIFYNSSNDLWENKTIDEALGYTPANDSLVVKLAGTQTITGSKTFSLAPRNDGGILLKDGVTTGSSGYVSVGSNGAGLTIGVYNSGTTYFHELLMPYSASYNYTFPAATGTLALLEGAQTFSGAKAFTQNLSLDGNGSNAGTLLLKSNSALPTAIGYSSLNTTSNTIYLTTYVSNPKTAAFDLSGITDNTIRIFTLPNTSGTIALTSNLSAYVPYTGATSNLDLGGYSLYLNNSQAVFGRNLAGSTAYALIGVNGSNKVSIDTSGLGVVLGGALSGTSATFSSSVTASSLVKSGGTSSQYLMADGSTSTLSNPVTGTGTTNYLPKFTGTSTIGNSNLINDASGNLGLGVTPSAWSANWRAIQLSGGSIFNYLTSEIHLGQNFYYSTSAIANYQNNGFASDYWQYNGQHIWMTAPSGTAGAAITFTQAMTLASTGNLLVGTTTDAGYKLRVQGTSYFFDQSVFADKVGIGTTSPNHILSLSATASNATVIGLYNTFSDATNRNWAIATNQVAFGDFDIRQSTAQNGNPITSGTSRLYINASGAATFSSSVTAGGNNITIQPTTTTTYALSVMQNAGGYLRVGRDTSTGALYGDAYASLLVSSGAYPLIIGTNDTERMRLTSGGNVLIGTTTDSGYKLDVNGTGRFSGQVTVGSDLFLSLSTASIVFNSAANFNTQIYQTGGSLVLYTGANPRLTIASTGAATFSSSVTAANSVSITGNYPSISLNATSGTNFYIESTFTSNRLSFGVIGNAPSMAITSGGNVGIGTSSINYKLEVVNSTNQYVFHSFNTRNTSGDTNVLLQLGNNCNNTGSYFLVASMPLGDRMYIYGNGNIVNINGSYGTLSDATLKENIIDATPKLADILNLKVRNFNLIGDDTKQIGFIAQEFEEVFPSMIDLDGKSGKKAIKTSVLTPMLVKGLQELKAEKDAEILELRSQIEELKALIAAK